MNTLTCIYEVYCIYKIDYLRLLFMGDFVTRRPERIAGQVNRNMEPKFVVRWLT
jgi:hypothetical protein